MIPSQVPWPAWGLVLSSLLVVGGVPGCSPPPEGSLPDVLLLTIDTLRGDRWGCLGDPAARTPHVDRLARGSLLAFEGRAPAPITLPSHVSMMTGLPPASHGVRDNGIFRLPADQGTTLAEAMRGAGYATAAFVSAFPLARGFGLDRGFERYDSYLSERDDELAGMRQRTAGESIARLEGWLSGARGEPPRAGAPLFLWVHFFDPHAEYQPPPPWDSLFRGDPYRGEVAYTDRETGRLFRLLSRFRGGRPLVAVAAADHGEGLHEHGESTHGALIHASTIRVPILVRGPDYAPQLLADALSVERVAATVLSAAGLDVRLNPGSAPSLTDAPTPVHAETLYPFFNFGWSGLRAREEDGWRLIAGPVDRLFRLRDDPGETRDLASQHPEIVSSLREALEAEWEKRRGQAFSTERQALSESEAEALRALGYVAGGDGGEQAADSGFDAGDDPHARLSVVDRINGALTHLRDGRPDSAASSLRGVVREDPRNRFAYQYLGRALEAAGRPEEARSAFRVALDLGPNPDWVYRELARVERALGDVEAARVLLLEALALNPQAGQTRNALAGLLLEEGRLDEARSLLLETVKDRPRLTQAWARLARIADAQGRPEEARECWERVLELADEGPAAAAARERLARGGGSGEGKP